jgi:hypothetical protein
MKADEENYENENGWGNEPTRYGGADRFHTL